MKQKINKKEPKGLGGWLVLFQIGLILSIIIIFKAILNFNSDDFEIRFNILSMLLNILTIMAMGYVLILFYTKSKRFQKTAIIVLWASVAIYLLSMILASFSQEIDASLRVYLFVSIVSNTLFQTAKATIWTLYLKKSKRVKNTFVN